MAALAAAQVFDIIRVTQIAAGSSKYRREYNCGHTPAKQNWTAVIARARVEAEADFDQLTYWLSWLNIQESKKRHIVDMVRDILDGRRTIEIEIPEI
jgi:hypothetical protein